jgi:hypothetical protein
MALPAPPCQPIDAVMDKQDKERAERLAAALRANLRKRKAQARAQGAPKPKEKD